MILSQLLAKHSSVFTKVVPFNTTTNKLLLMDFTANNTTLTNKILADTTLFSQYVNEQMQQATALYGIGGYNEHRTIYARSEVFDGTKEPRRIHLGIDVWGKAGTPVFAPIGGMIHSFAFNNQFGDYGATIILQHQLEGVQFHTLYGHLSLASIEHLQEGKYVSQGELLAHFGEPNENGHWPPHLHFQIIKDLEGKFGDYPGVCAAKDVSYYKHNCPDPNLLLKIY
jgi:murein DD-endopeptidase MepM/ murein hydrolase activator NlpD